MMQRGYAKYRNKKVMVDGEKFYGKGKVKKIVFTEEWIAERKEAENNVFRGRPFICKKHLLQFQK